MHDGRPCQSQRVLALLAGCVCTAHGLILIRADPPHPHPPPTPNAPPPNPPSRPAGVAHLASLRHLTSLNWWNCLRVTGGAHGRDAQGVADSSDGEREGTAVCNQVKPAGVGAGAALAGLLTTAGHTRRQTVHALQSRARPAPYPTPRRSGHDGAAPHAPAGRAQPARLPAAGRRLSGAPGAGHPAAEARPGAHLLFLFLSCPVFQGCMQWGAHKWEHWVGMKPQLVRWWRVAAPALRASP